MQGKTYRCRRPRSERTIAAVTTTMGALWPHVIASLMPSHVPLALPDLWAVRARSSSLLQPATERPQERRKMNTWGKLILGFSSCQYLGLSTFLRAFLVCMSAFDSFDPNGQVGSAWKWREASERGGGGVRGGVRGVC